MTVPCPHCGVLLMPQDVCRLMHEMYPRRYRPTGRPRGRPKIKRHCGVCGSPCESGTAAAEHCRERV